MRRYSSIFAIIISLLCLAWASDAFACLDRSGLLDVNCDGKVVVVTFGDSITYGISDSTGLGYPGRLNQIFPEAIFVNLGVPGENTYTGRGRAANIFSLQADADFAIILEGINDYWQPSRDSAVTRSNLLAIKTSAERVGAITLLAKLTDVRRDIQKSWVGYVNTKIDPYTSIDFFSLGTGIISGDLVHPNANGYQAMANLVAPILLQLSNANRPIDTDGDGVYDWAESTKYGTNPNLVDSDGDGLSDAEELFVYGSSPLLVDTDGDGYNDPYEVSKGANPGSRFPNAPKITSLEILPR